MNTIKINILKKSVMGVVEGLTTTIAAHNPDVDFETIWASDSEEPKLDIYYREAITDLENELSSFSASTMEKFDLQSLADDFSLVIETLAYWPTRLSGLLTNQIQNYLVHTVMSGWLSDFPDIKAMDYASMGVSDLQAVKEILLKKDFTFLEDARHEDGGLKNVLLERDLANRDGDSDAKSDVGQRFFDREKEGEKKDGNKLDSLSRLGDGRSKGDNVTVVSSRSKDFARQHFRHEKVDWSGGRPPYRLK